jgi:integrase
MRIFKRKTRSKKNKRPQEIWYVDYAFEGKRARKPVGTNKLEAQKALDVIKGKIASGKYDIEDSTHSITFSKMAEIYRAYSEKNKKSFRTDKGRLRKLEPYFEYKKLHNITPYDIEKMKQDLLDKLSPATVNRYLALLKHMFSLAIKWKKAKYNPVKDVAFLKENNRRLRYLQEEEIPILIKNCHPQLRPLVLTAVYTGIRQRKLFELKWADVDFKNNLITIENSKSGETRQVPMSSKVRQTLLTLQSNNDSDYVFLNRYGRPFKDIRTSFHTALKRSGIKDFRFHDLRHTFAAHLAMAGIPLLTIKELMGHKTIEMTMRYAHLSRKHTAAAVETLQRRIEVAEWHQSGTPTFLEENKKRLNPLNK